jgi:hypothetical protein
MKKILKTICALLLMVNGVGAIYGGGNLILHPDGSSIRLAKSLLIHTPFESYLIPGIVLFIVNGLFSFFVLFTMIFKLRKHQLLIICQGVLLTGWIFIQILMIQTVYFLHLIMGGIGIILIIAGLLLNNRKI